MNIPIGMVQQFELGDWTWPLHPDVVGVEVGVRPPLQQPYSGHYKHWEPLKGIRSTLFFGLVQPFELLSIGLQLLFGSGLLPYI